MIRIEGPAKIGYIVGDQLAGSQGLHAEGRLKEAYLFLFLLLWIGEGPEAQLHRIDGAADHTRGYAEGVAVALRIIGLIYRIAEKY